MKAKLFLLLLLLPIAAIASRIDTLQIHSPEMNKNVEVIVITPQSKTKARKARTITAIKRYPVVYVLHGADDDGGSYLRNVPDLPQNVDRMGAILVFPTVHNSWYFDSPVRKDYCYETFITKTLIDTIDARYPTIADRKARAIMGIVNGRTWRAVSCFQAQTTLFCLRLNERRRGF